MKTNTRCLVYYTAIEELHSTGHAVLVALENGEIYDSGAQQARQSTVLPSPLSSTLEYGTTGRTLLTASAL